MQGTLAKKVKLEECKKFFVMSSGCKGKWSYHHSNVAVVGTTDGSKPRVIRDTSKALVVHYWARLNVGTTNKCEFRQVLARASALVEELNNTAGEQK